MFNTNTEYLFIYSFARRKIPRSTKAFACAGDTSSPRVVRYPINKSLTSTNKIDEQFKNQRGKVYGDNCQCFITSPSEKSILIYFQIGRNMIFLIINKILWQQTKRDSIWFIIRKKMTILSYSFQIVWGTEKGVFCVTNRDSVETWRFNYLFHNCIQFTQIYYENTSCYTK